MKYSRITTGLVAALLLSACDMGPDLFSGLGGTANCTVTNGNSVCTPGPPGANPPGTLTVDAGPGRAAVDGDSVYLNGNAVHSKNKLLTYQWSQVSGPPVTLTTLADTGAKLRHATFIAPPVRNISVLEFRFRVTSPNDGLVRDDYVVITVEPASAYAICLYAPLFVTSYAWSNGTCKTNSTDILAGSRTATIYRQSEIEPNDTAQLATPLTFPMPVEDERIGTDVAGSISGGINVLDHFVFTVPKTDTYSVYLCTDPVACTRNTVTADWTFYLLDQDFTVLQHPHYNWSNDVTTKLDAGLPYYIEVHGTMSANVPPRDYNLTILSEPD